MPADHSETHAPRWSVLVAALIGVGAVSLLLTLNPSSSSDSQQATPLPGRDDLARYLPFDGDKAYEHLVHICDLGPRISGSQAMVAQRAYIETHLTQHGATIEKQEWPTRHPETGEQVMLVNLFGRYHPEREERILLCCHYDTRPYADEDPIDPKVPLIGANDGASGVAVLMELARHLAQVDTKYGVDLVFLDAEEFIFDKERDPFFLGSTYFAQRYRQADLNFHYRWGILLDMVGDKDLQIYQERNSLSWRDTRPLVHEVWGVARKLNIPEFVPKPRHAINDDHVPLHNIGGIPIINIIDFDYPNPASGNKYWHTRHDVPENCSGLSLAKVGKVVLTWLEQVE